MSYAVVLRANAERGIDAAADWYHERNPRVARIFLIAVARSIQGIAENPGGYPAVQGDFRRALVAGFPYSLLYRVRSSTVVITTCVHFRRHPRLWT